MKVLITHVDLDGYGGNILSEIFKDKLRFDYIFNLSYGFENTEVINDFLNKNTEIVIMDLSVDENTFIEWSRTVKSLKIFDHHLSSKYLHGYHSCIWNENKSGTKIFYEEYVYPRVKDFYSKELLERVKNMVNLISIYDLWEDTNESWTDALRLNRLNTSYGKSFIKYAVNKIQTKEINEWDLSDLEIFEKEELEEKEYLEDMENGLVLRHDNYNCIFAITEIPKKSKLSNVSSELLKNHPEIDYLIIKCPYLNSYSLRTRKDIDLTEMLHGCFGHAKACGCHIDIEDEPYLYLSERCPKHIEKGERKSKVMILEEYRG